jgi:serine/threonine protein kinase
VALKKLKDEADSKTFLQEAEVISQLRHPNIVVFLGIFEDPKAGIYIVMEYLELGSLDKLLAVEEERITIPMVENM